MIELEDSPDDGIVGNKDFSYVSEMIPWEKFDTGKSAFIPYNKLPGFTSKAHAINYLRILSNRRGVSFGFKFKVIDDAVNTRIEIRCYGKREALGFKKVGRPAKVAEAPEDRAGRHKRAMAVANERYPSDAQFGTLEYLENFKAKDIYATELFNHYESQVENPVLIDMAEVLARHARMRDEFDNRFTQQQPQQSVGWNTPIDFVKDDE